jgi:hypothetical protein
MWRCFAMMPDPRCAVFFLILLVPACASGHRPMSMVTVPAKLNPGANESLEQVVHAKGVQIYECRVKKDQVGGY